MKSVGEVMAIGRTFQESLQKALRGLETGVDGLDEKTTDPEVLETELGDPGPERIWYVADAFRCGLSFEQIERDTHIDPWFLAQIEDMVRQETELKGRHLEDLDARALRTLKRNGFSDRRLATLLAASESQVRERRCALEVRPVYKRVDTCAAEFATNTAYMYSTYEEECGPPTRARRSWCSGGAPIGSARGSSSTTAACTLHSRCARSATRPSWSTAIRRRFRRITTRPTGCTSSR